LGIVQLCPTMQSETRAISRLPVVRGLLPSRGVQASPTTAPRLFLILALNICLQLYDGLATLLGVGRGFAEGNPLVKAAMVHIGDAGGLAAAKLIAILLLVYLYRRRSHPWVVPGMVVLAVVYTVFAILPWTAALAMTTAS
jgi:hypothetical protein